MKQSPRSNRNICLGDLTNREYDDYERYRAEKRENIHVIRYKKRCGKCSSWRRRRRQQRRVQMSRRGRASLDNQKIPEQKLYDQNGIKRADSHAEVAEPLFETDVELTDPEWSVPTDEEWAKIYEEIMNTYEEPKNTLEDYSLFNDYYLGKK